LSARVSANDRTDFLDWAAVLLAARLFIVLLIILFLA
jgi:hypothetical protein